MGKYVHKKVKRGREPSTDTTPVNVLLPSDLHQQMCLRLISFGVPFSAQVRTALRLWREGQTRKSLRSAAFAKMIEWWNKEERDQTNITLDTFLDEVSCEFKRIGLNDENINFLTEKFRLWREPKIQNFLNK